MAADAQVSDHAHGQVSGGVQGRPYKSEPVKKAEAEIDKLREDLTRVREEKRQLADLLGAYAVMNEQLARERAEVITERDEALATRDAALGVTALNPPPQRTAPTSRAHRPLPRGRQ
ncbi:hypothetical protein [Streptomyces sp. NPDC004284]|uniref:hypothetical protein n=1 Tax=Streptomyces sp. NPDC004284 TaxID=3364695 RepID=UPI0036A11C65